MKYRRCMYNSAERRTEIWDRWQRGETMRSIDRQFGRKLPAVISVLSTTSGLALKI